jgi:bacillithiol biosynthesis cysteine-adding enzyme BshC
VTPKTIPYTEELGFSRLFQDFVSKSATATEFFHERSFSDVALQLDRKSFDRQWIHDLLHRQNSDWNAPAQVMEAIEKTADPKAVMLFAGQQAGLFAGPYLVILKVLGTVKRARQLETELDRPVIPVFWIAADDHDVDEISRTAAFDRKGNIVEIELDREEEASPPVGALQYDEKIGEAIATADTLLPDNDFKSPAIDPLRGSYKDGHPIVDAFAQYLLSLVGRFGVILFNPYDESVKEKVVPFFQDIVTRHDDLKQRLIDVDKKLVERGYHLQVEKAQTALHLFHHHPHRDALHSGKDDYVCGNMRFTKEDLLAKIEHDPLSFSTDVMTRPLLQSFLFPTLGILAGPAEISYYAQLLRLFELFDTPAPRIIARPSATIVEARYEKHMHEYELTLPDLAGDVEDIINRVLRDTFPEDYQKRFDTYREEIAEGIRELRQDLIDYDKNLQPMIDRTREKIDYQLKELDKKIFAAHKKKNKTERDRIYRLRDNLFPNGNLPERVIAPFYFVSRYGSQIFDFLFEKIQIDETGHQLLLLSEYNGQT